MYRTDQTRPNKETPAIKLRNRSAAIFINFFIFTATIRSATAAVATGCWLWKATSHIHEHTHTPEPTLSAFTGGRLTESRVSRPEQRSAVSPFGVDQFLPRRNVAPFHVSQPVCFHASEWPRKATKSNVCRRRSAFPRKRVKLLCDSPVAT